MRVGGEGIADLRGQEERPDPIALDGDALGRPVAALPPEPVGEREDEAVVLDPYAAGVAL
jgi:hypothetical protein